MNAEKIEKDYIKVLTVIIPQMLRLWVIITIFFIIDLFFINSIYYLNEENVCGGANGKELLPEGENQDGCVGKCLLVNCHNHIKITTKYRTTITQNYWLYG